MAQALINDRNAAWPQEVLAGVASAPAVAAVPITLGLLVYAALGDRAGAVGIPAAFVTILVGGLVVAVLGDARMPATGPTSATALILAALVARLLGDPQLGAHGVSAETAALALAALTVVLSGVLMVAFGALRFSALVAFVPRPVLSGFMNGVALLIAWSQVPSLLGVPAAAWRADGLHALQALQPATLAFGLAAFVLGLVVAARRPRWPASLIVLVTGTVAYHALALVAPATRLGEVTGPLPAHWPGPVALAPLLQGAGALLQQHAAAVVSTALILAVIGSLESSLNVMAVDQHLQHHSDLGRDLRATGLANVAIGVFGGLPGPQLRIRAMTTLQLGGRTPLAAAVGAIASGVLVVVAAPLLAQLPRVVLAATMGLIAVALVDRWWLQLMRQWLAGDRSPDLAANIVVGWIVMLVTLFAGFAVAVSLGVLLSLALFIRSMNRGLVRGRWTGQQRPSRRLYLPHQERVLAEARAAIEGVELDGALYFGSAERVEGEVRAVRPATRFLVVDLRRVGTLDATGANALVQLAGRLAARGVRLVLAGLQPGPAASLRAFGGGALAAAAHHDADRAVEAAECALLAEAQLDAPTHVPLAQSMLLQGLAPAQAERVGGLLVEQRLAAGARVFAEGDPADALYVVGSGTVAVVGAAPATADGLAGVADVRRSQRFISASAGMILGEVAVLDGGGRTGAALAETDVVIYRLAGEDLDRLRDADPALAAALYRNIAVHLSQRLRAAVSAWRHDAI